MRVWLRFVSLYFESMALVQDPRRITISTSWRLGWLDPSSKGVAMPGLLKCLRSSCRLPDGISSAVKIGPFDTSRYVHGSGGDFLAYEWQMDFLGNCVCEEIEQWRSRSRLRAIHVTGVRIATWPALLTKL